MAQRTCTVDGCERKHLARGLCGTHYNKTRYTSRERHPKVTVPCSWCGQPCQKRKDERRFKVQFCSYDCRSAHRKATGHGEKLPTKCRLPLDHPVMLRITEERKAAKSARVERVKRRIEWRTARECPGCGCTFSPLWTPNMLTCSKRCARRVHRWRRRAAEVNAPGSWVWSDFMRVAQRFGFRCAYCGDKPGALDPDHVVPLSRGGYNSVANLLPACRPCNADKRDLLLDEWNMDRERRGLAPRLTTWAPEDKRFHHLTQALLSVA